MIPNGQSALCCGQFQDPMKLPTFLPPLLQIFLSLTQIHRVHTLLGSAQPGRTSSARSLSVPSAAAELPAVLSRKRPTAPAWHEGLGEGASVGD